MKTSSHLLSVAALSCLLALELILPSTVHGLTSSGTSSIITVDTTATNIPVSGRVLDIDTKQPLSGAILTLAGKTATSASDGAYTLKNVDLSEGRELTISRYRYETQTETVSASSHVKSIVMPDILLTGTSINPVVEWIKPDIDGIFLWGCGHVATVWAKVNWKNTQPKQVTFTTNGEIMAYQLGGAGPLYSSMMSIDNWLYPSLRLDGNTLKVEAENVNGLKGKRTKNVAVVPIPEALSTVLLSTPWTDADGKIGAKIKFPAPALKKTVSLPIIGTFGAEFQCEGEFEYEISSGQWKFELLGAGSRAKVILDKTELAMGLTGKGEGTATSATGIKMSSLEFNPTVALSGKFRLGAYGLPQLIPGGLLLAQIPALRPVLSSVVIVVMLEPELNAQGIIRAYPDPHWAINSLEVMGKFALEAFYEPKIWGMKVRFYVGGEPSATFQVPGDIFKEANFKAYAGGKVRVWTIDWKTEYIFVDYTYASSPGRRLPTTGIYDVGNGYLIESANNKNAAWQPMDRSYRNAGTEQFLLGNSSPARRLSVDQSNPALDLFRRMGNATTPGAVYQPPATGPARRIESDSTLPAQASLPLLSNVYPDAEPALAASGSNLMLLYVRDTGAQNATQFTEIAFSRFDGTNWSTPAAVAANPRGQFMPKVAMDGNGNAVAVWEQIKDAAFTGTDISTIAAQMEIMTSTWNATTQTWSPATALTDNTFLDHEPKIAGPLTDGNLILTWVQNQANQIVGSGTPGALENNRVMTARWNSATAAWEAPSVLVDNLSSDLSHSLAAAGNKAVYIWSQDQDGNLDDLNDTELYYRTWNETGGTWSNPTRYTNNAIGDRNARVAVDAGGDTYVVWQHGSDLVMDRNFAGTPGVVRADSTSMGFADFTLALGPGGNLMVLWEDMASTGPDAHYRVFDPASNTWGLDTMLSNDADLEQSFAPVWDTMGNLVLAYNNAKMTKQTVSVPIEGGGTIDVPGVAQPETVELTVARRALVKDLSFAASALTTSGTSFLPGDQITLTAKVTNSGNVAVQNVQVGFYDGDPQYGGTLIQTVTLPDWLKAADTRDATITWTIPSPIAPHTIYAVVDPAGQVTELDKTNNTQSLSLNGVDLELQYISGAVDRSGAVHVAVQVRNIGTPQSPVSTLKLWLNDGFEEYLVATKEVSLLNPGDAVQVTFDLSEGTQWEGAYSYRVTVDEDNLSGDINPSNNKQRFSLSLFIDDDGDGIPYEWEAAHGMDDYYADDALEDWDGDGFTNYQEYLAGTDPNNPASRLKTGQTNVIMQPDGKSAQFTISWVPATNGVYTVERSFDLTTWSAVATHIKATEPLNSYTDTVTLPAGGTRCFYRVRVE